MKYILTSLLLLWVTNLYAGDIWLLSVGDTADPVLGRSAQRDLEAIKSLAKEAAKNTDQGFFIENIPGTSLSWSGWDQALSRVKAGPQDVLILYFSTDGRKSAQSAWPDILLGGQVRNLYALSEKMASKQIGLLILLAECPQKIETQNRDKSYPLAPQSFPYAQGWRDLFLHSRGLVMMASAESGEESWAYPEGGALTVTLVEALRQGGEKSAGLTWKSLLQDVKSQVQEDTAQKQNPLMVAKIQRPPAGKVGPIPQILEF